MKRHCNFACSFSFLTLGPVPPRELIVTDVRATRFRLSWTTDESDAISPHMKEYRVNIFKKGISERVQIVPYENAANTETIIIGLQCGTRYFIELTAHTTEPKMYSDAISTYVTTGKCIIQ